MHRIDLDRIKLHPQNNLYIIGGIHGSGKSTFCRALIKELNLPYITPEELKKELPVSTSRNKLLKYLREKVTTHLENRQSFYFEHVMSGNYVEKLIGQAKNKCFITHVIYIIIARTDIANERITKRVRLGGHDIGRNQIHARLIESRENFLKKYANLADSYHLYDNSSTPYQLIASR